MPSSRFPWAIKSPASSSRERRVSADISRLQADEDDEDIQKPTRAEYAKVAGKEFLSVLGAVAQAIPIPGIGAVVTTAMNVIKACDESHATLDTAKEMKLRVKMLMMVMVNELKGKKPDDISDKLRQDLGDIQDGLAYIEKKLDEIASQRALSLVFFRGLNDEKVRKCNSRLGLLMERFTVTQQIDHTILMERLEKEIVGFYDAQKHTLDHIHRGVDSVGIKLDDVNVTMKDVKAMMESHSPTAGLSSTGARATVPANSSIFYGRESLVSKLTSHLVSSSEDQRRHHVCILGPGGMGKTSTALAVMAHSAVQKCYPDGHRVWVPCVKATSVAVLLDTLALSLGIRQLTGNISDNILAALSSAGPLILLLDNFETPWNVDGGRSETERILRNINQIPHITLFLTMRSSTPPCGELPWESTYLQAVDSEAARQIYSEIYPDSSTDSLVAQLLDLIGNMPLAITLMATSAKLSKISAKHLIDQYKKIGPTMLSQGSDAEHSMDICISLSVDSPPMKRSSDAQWLLAALSMLPVGTTYDMLVTWWARSVVNVTGALQILRETSLIDLQDSTFSVLPVIQRYILDPSRFNESVRDSMIGSACKFLEEHNSAPGDDSYKAHTAALAAEEGNLEAVLLQTVTPSIEILKALLVLAKYQASARLRTSVISRALMLAQEMGNQSVRGDVLWCYGDICCHLNRYEESREHYNNAREIFLSLNDTKQAAKCLLAFAYTYQLDLSASPESCYSLVACAQSEFTSIDDRHGVAQCWLARGYTSCHIGEYHEALNLLHRAQDELIKHRNFLKAARCSHIIAWCYYWQEDFEQAKTWSESSAHEFDRVGSPDGRLDALLQLGAMYNNIGDHAAALQTMIQCLEQLKVFGAPLHMGKALEVMGTAWMQMRKMEDARGAFQEALEVYPSLAGRQDLDRCRFWLKKVENPDIIPTYEEWRALRSYYPSKALDQYGVEERWIIDEG